MKKLVSVLALTITVLALTFAAGADTLSGTMVRESNADPNLFFYNGNYYLTQTGTSRIAVFESKTLEGLDDLAINSNISYIAYLNGVVYDPTVEELFGTGATVNGTWSPEIHYFSEEQFPGNSGWYMFVGLRKNTGDSSVVRMVVLKSTTDSPKGPYGHPTKGTKNYSQPLLDKDGEVYDVWGCGQTVLVIPEGEYKGTYAMWVAEEGRETGLGGINGDFYQKIMIAKMSSPWQLASDPAIVTTPTQDWEYAGASSTHPRVVEGATPVYGKNGEIFITYSGSGYWSDYGLGQITWTGGDPLKTSSWVKLPVEYGNPIFTATTAKNLRGAGHASFLTDTDGNGFFCYHAYAYENSTKASSRDAYIEPYYIDYTEYNGTSYGVIKLGLDGNGVAADTSSTVTFATDGEYLTAPDIAAEGGERITVSLSCTDADGFIIYRSSDGKVFEYLATIDESSYTDSSVESNVTYYYRAYAYREEEISDVSETVSAKAKSYSPKPAISVSSTCSSVEITETSGAAYTVYNIYRSADGESFAMCGLYNDGVFVDENVSVGETYYYYVIAAIDGYYGSVSDTVSVTVAHNEVSVSGADATCTEDGYYAYSYCSHCETPIIEKEVIPASHSYELTSEEVPPTTSAEGKTAVYTCSACGDTYGGDVIDVIVLGDGDANGDGKVTLIDALRALRTAVGEEVEINKSNADMDGDRDITVADVLLIVKAILDSPIQK